VTGAASGIGRALAEIFAREGASVVVADLDPGGAEAAAGALRARGGKAIAVPADVSDRDQVERLADRAYSAFGAVHVLCNNAGVALHGGLETASHRDWQWVLGVNLWGVIHGLEAFLPRMIAGHEPGHIVNTASMAGLIASQGLGVYNVSKYAVVGLSETLVKDLRPYGIGVTVLCPMGVATSIGDSARNRPSALRNELEPAGARAVATAPPATVATAPPALIGRTLSPETVAEMTVAAVRANRLYVITHEEGLEPLRRRFERLERAILESAGHSDDPRP
jgi:NAD(P)-dependent dehydrogenase (short-subunit alcohol dehydrogenase family)